MTFTPTIKLAIDVAAKCHATHKRIGLDLPYIVHPYSVAIIATEHEQGEDIFCAALLHDVIEDSDKYTSEMMRNDFGGLITDIVLSLTENKSGGDSLEKLKQNWEWRKRGYLDKLRQAPRQALVICAADSIHNLQSLCQLKHLHGDKFFGSFGASLDRKMWFYGEVLSILRKLLDSSIVGQLAETYQNAVNELKVD